MFGYRLAAHVGAWHPDFLLDCLTWEQWQGWQQAYEQDPWGELRADMRASVNTLHGMGSGETVSPIWPYYGDGDELGERIEAIEKRKASLDESGMKERLKRARELHKAAKAKQDGG